MSRRKGLVLAALLAWCSLGVADGRAASGESQAEKASAPAGAEHPPEKKAAESKSADASHVTEVHPPAKDSAAKSGEHAATPEGTHAGSHAGHHDPTDVGHQDAGPKLEDPSQWKSDLAICTLIVFLCLLALLSKFAWRPVMDGLEARERGIAASIDDAKRSADKAAEQLRQYEARLAAATEETRGILDQARRDADAAKDRIVAEAQEAAQRERQRAVQDIAAAKNVAMQEISQRSVDLAVSLAGKLIHQKLRPEDHTQLIREMIDQFPSRN